MNRAPKAWANPREMLGSRHTEDGSTLIDIRVDDPAYDYSHEQPFPDRGTDTEGVDAFFGRIMKQAAGTIGWLDAR